MEGRQPKRRKDKYNPYKIYEKTEDTIFHFQIVWECRNTWK